MNAPVLPSIPRHRSSAVARMLGMPVATLRVWERRYGLTGSMQPPGAQRRYGEADVQRLALIKRLVDGGHAIGHLASLDMAQLQRMATVHAQTQAEARAPVASAPPWRLLVVGRALGQRLLRPAVLRQLGRPVDLLGPFDDLAQAAQALASADAAAPIAACLLQAPQLHAGWLAELEAAAPALAPLPKAVLYGFAPDAVCEALAARGVALLREPQPDAALAQWLRLLSLASVASPPAVPPADLVAPRRWDDAALAAFGARSSSVACECPRHVAELLVQLSRFEAYSAGCASRSPADAALHEHLAGVAAAARARFEQALVRVALHEGLPLPPATA